MNPRDAIVIAAASVFATACVSTGSGTAYIHPANDQTPNTNAFRGLLAPTSNTPPVRYVFMTHGMGPTPHDFADILLQRFIRNAGFSNVKQWTGSDVGGWIPIELPRPVIVTGANLSCSRSPATGECEIRKFGGYKIDKLARGSETVFVYRYFWDRSLRLLEEPFLKNDNAVQRSDVSGQLKHQVVNYGFSDAAAYLGELGNVMRSSAEGAVCAMMRHAQLGEPPENPAGACRFEDLPEALPRAGATFSFLSQSLGSRLLFDTLTFAYDQKGNCLVDARNVKHLILDRTDSFFMLANQLPLLAIGQIKVRPRSPAPLAGTLCDVSLLDQLASARGGDRSPSHASVRSLTQDLPPLQIVSFQDPEDLLGFALSDDLVAETSNRIRVVEVRHRNTAVRTALGISFSLPMRAHAVELERDTSARLIFCGATIDDGGRLRAQPDCVYTD